MGRVRLLRALGGGHLRWASGRTRRGHLLPEGSRHGLHTKQETRHFPDRGGSLAGGLVGKMYLVFLSPARGKSGSLVFLGEKLRLGGMVSESPAVRSRSWNSS